ncbi:L,D-transpeptidase [Aureimonas glaciei]|jgi:lipoprotein-anchoring transpeptidase ErfK/SrfK|uniref:L,D-transpeptidase n=1 Tax=Aureimonas glaciei TaxID=1776957 RepID=A0A916Y1S0_9HYPH|nr:L,D-transpeptidase [Aureimonas glaciei]GGD26586.1 L,D-transpeptidase [Aureimonas glaciei]
MRPLLLAACLVLSVAGPSSTALAAGDPKPRWAEETFASDYDPGTIVIKTSERKLYLVTGATTALRYEIAVGRPSEQWFGESFVTRKRFNPTWVPTPSMREKNPALPQSVGPGPSNPLGVRAMNLGWGTYRIHGTNSPRSIGSAASSGCFRMRNADVSDLFDRVHVGAQVIVLK